MKTRLLNFSLLSLSFWLWELGFRLQIWNQAWEKNMREVFELRFSVKGYEFIARVEYSEDKKQWLYTFGAPFIAARNDLYVKTIAARHPKTSEHKWDAVPCWNYRLFKLTWGFNPDLERRSML